jgi:pimeloyl-ACP methyl ester carboxylesterase
MTLCGASLGGAIALDFAYHHPEAVHKLVRVLVKVCLSFYEKINFLTKSGCRSLFPLAYCHPEAVHKLVRSHSLFFFAICIMFLHTKKITKNLLCVIPSHFVLFFREVLL